MVANRRKIIIFSVIILAAIIFFLDPFSAILRVGGPPRSMLDDAKLKSFTETLVRDANPAVDAAAKLVSSKQVTFVGERGFIAEEINFAQSLLRRSPELGVTAVGLELVLQDDQARLDALMNAQAFDETEARTLMLRHIPVFGLQEYLDILRALWETGKIAASQGKAFRVYGLSYMQDYSLIVNPEDTGKPEILRKILSKGTPDDFMAKQIIAALSAPGSRMIVFAHRRFGFARAQEMSYAQGLVKMGFADPRHSAALVADKIGGASIGTILCHSPWTDPASAVDKLCWPYNGWVDQALKAASTRLVLPFGLDTRTSSLGTGKIEHGDFKTLDSTQPVLSDLCDLYVVLAPIAMLTPAKPIADFINKDNFSQATEHLPKLVNSTTLSPEGINASIQRNAESLKQELANFQ